MSESEHLAGDFVTRLAVNFLEILDGAAGNLVGGGFVFEDLDGDPPLIVDFAESVCGRSVIDLAHAGT